MKLIISSEHGGNIIPKQYQFLFDGKDAILKSHRGFDPGTADLFEYLKEISDFSEKQMISRLLIECNRSLHHPKLFSEFTKLLSQDDNKYIIENYYLPYRSAIEKTIENHIDNGKVVLHISLHSFTPKLENQVRNNDIGLLYDPKRTIEKEFCKDFKDKLKLRNPELKIRFNFPYTGSADGFTTYLRKRFTQNYIGVELEINQKLVNNASFPIELKNNLKLILKGVL